MKNILIIGHSSGIGKALSEKLTEEARVYGTYCKNQPAETSTNVSSHYLNVLDEQTDFSFLPEELDGLVYCPGAINLKPFGRVSEEDLINDYKLQVVGAIKTIQACLPRLKKSKSASIVLFSTVAVKMGFSFHSIVSASKGAIEGLTRSLSAELAPSIRVNCIAPSITQTPLAASILSSQEKIDANAQRHPLKRVGESNDIASIAAFLVSNESSWITGQIFHVDGGMSSIK